MNSPKLIFITGPSGSGKSTTALELAHVWPTKCALLDFDNIRTNIKSGYAEPANGWNDDTAEQWEIAKRIVTVTAKEYINNGISVVLEAFATPDDFPQWRDLFKEIPYSAFALLPNLEDVLKRNNGRTGVAKLNENDIKQNFEWSVAWPQTSGITVIDNSKKSVKDIAAQIIKETD